MSRWVLGVLALGLAVIPRDDGGALTGALRSLYARPTSPAERWGSTPTRVRLPDGTTVARDDAYRDHPSFVRAAAALMSLPSGDDAPLGAWLLGTTPAHRRVEAEPALLRALGSLDVRVVFEAAQSLGKVGSSTAVAPLRREASTHRDAAVRGAARWAAREIESPQSTVDGPPSPRALPATFLRGVNWWFEGHDADAGAASFRDLRRMGVEWVSIHSWDPRQKSVRSPDFAEPGRWSGISRLDGIVRAAHAAGLKVMVKPHLEMWHRPWTTEERRRFEEADAGERHRLFESYRAERARQGWHNDIEMGSDADWRAWFANYDAYLMPYARGAQHAGADMLCVGRELDRTMIARAGDWRALIGRVRTAFKGPLTYSANFDGYAKIGLWDALDFIGISAYFPLATSADPTVAELESGWDRVLGDVERFHRAVGRSVLFTEVGLSSVSGSAAAPWEERDGPADPWLQARYYEATLRAVSRRPWVEGAFFWLWEGTRKPPFRDRSFSIQGKPASFVMAGSYW